MRTNGVAVDSRRANLGLLVVVTGILIAAIDTTIVVLALPEIQRSLHIGISSAIWVIIVYVFAITLLATQVGRLGDMFGRSRMYETGFLVFVIGSALCAVAWNETSMVGFRALQGIGGALISANSSAIVADTIPLEHRGRAYGFIELGWNFGAIAGIVLGGIMVTYISWRWIFWINVPIGIFALVLALRVLSDQEHRISHRIDFAGMITLGTGLLGVIWAITRVATTPLAGVYIAALTAGCVLLILFLILEHFEHSTMINLAIFRVHSMSSSLLASFFQSLANFAVIFLVLMYLEGVRELTPLHASLLLVPGYLVGGLIAPIGGKLTDRMNALIPATAGLGFQAVALLVYSRLQPATGLWLVVVGSMLSGLGSGLFFPSNNSAVMRASPHGSFGIAAGMQRTFQNLGMVFSFSVAIFVASRSFSQRAAVAFFVGTAPLAPGKRAVFTHGIHAALFASMALLLLAAAISASRNQMGRRQGLITVAPES